MFKIAGILNFILAIGHLVSLIWAKQVFEAGGVGKEMEELALIHPALPYLLTVFVAIILFIFGLYAFSADTKIGELPLLKIGIFGIASIFILRAFAGIIEILISDVSVVRELAYSSTALFIGLLYLIGGINKWRRKI
ncbi:MAG: hypothetical protein E6767_04285 [Dysgonomonas sp.]|nr:hypothetical protein [Dysgonomonas sp.]